MDIRHIAYPLSTEYLSGSKQVIAIGDFDGVHLGHQDVILTAKAQAEKYSCSMAIMTFDPHPREVLGQMKYSRYLAPLQKRLELFRQLAVDTVYIVRFDPKLAAVSPQDFVRHMLARLNIHTIVVGFDFTFGYKGQGTVETLREMCGSKLDVLVVKPFNLHGEKVSSTLIREHLHLGRLEQVKRLTGRDYFITGTVIHGDERGREIGFPTANVHLNEPYVLPRQGVYSVDVTVGQRQMKYRGVMNLGVRPTFYEEEDMEPTLEVHLLDFTENLYGKLIKIEFLQYLRPEEKFDSVEELIMQIRKDIDHARSF